MVEKDPSNNNNNKNKNNNKNGTLSSSSSSIVSSSGGAKRKRVSVREDLIVWPPTVIVENTRLAKVADGRWTGIGNVEMAVFLSEIGHTLGKAKSSWGKEGHRGQVFVQYPPNLDGLREAERLHNHFKSHNRGREEWGRVHPTWHALPGHDLYEGPNFVRVDPETKQERRVFYGYIAIIDDMDKFPPPPKKKRQKHLPRCKIVNRKDIEAGGSSKIMVGGEGEHSF